MNSISTTQKISILSVLLLLGAITLYVLFLQHIATLRTEVTEAREDLAFLLSQDERTRALNTVILETEEPRTRLESRFLSLENPISFLDLIEELGRDVGVELEVESFEQLDDDKEKEAEAAATEQPPLVRGVLSVSGSWDSIYHLLELLDAFPYVVAVQKIALEEKEYEDTLFWEGQVHFRVAARP